MDSGPHDNIEVGVKADRLSNLSDDLIHKILSFVSINDTVKTMALSSRYRFIWTTMPYLNFDSDDFSSLQNFVDCFLQRRNNQIDVSSLYLDIGIKQVTDPSVKKLMRYAFSHNIQRVEVTCMPQGHWGKRFQLIEFPLSLFSSKSLEHLSLNNYWSRDQRLKLEAMSILELPALTTLYLEGITSASDDDANCCVITGLFSKCTNLKHLTLISCNTVDKSSLSICHPGLSNLTLYNIRAWSVNVVAPQLENLTITDDDDCSSDGMLEYVISAPNLASLAYRGRYPLHLSTDGFHSLKEADIRVLADPLDVNDAPQMVGLLQQLHNVKFLKLNLEIIEVYIS
uniref:F-box/FBD/LRR-repeat protein At1g80470-like n=1 Tax=Erigeron canadensis TaxID=72917 RepID=UPI001CB96633|nr:F-box/FBD/LRR-repeat protein At1g80470-like [Erigeron canadensis]